MLVSQPLQLQAERWSISGPKEDLAVVSCAVSQQTAWSSQRFSLRQLLAPKIHINGYIAVIWTHLDQFWFSASFFCPLSSKQPSRTVYFGDACNKKKKKSNSLNEKEKSIRKSQLSVKRPLISAKFKEHRSERGCGAFPTPSQQCVRLWHVKAKPQTQALCQKSRLCWGWAEHGCPWKVVGRHLLL